MLPFCRKCGALIATLKGAKLRVCPVCGKRTIVVRAPVDHQVDDGKRSRQEEAVHALVALLKLAGVRELMVDSHGRILWPSNGLGSNRRKRMCVNI